MQESLSAARAGSLFAALSNAQLADLTDRLCDSIHWAKRRGDRTLAAELQVTEHVVWHALCVRRGRRCLQDAA
jgi:hypothetical protein